MPSDEQIIVNEPSYLLKLVRLLNATDPRVIGIYHKYYQNQSTHVPITIKFELVLIVNYLNWRLVLKFGGETNQQIGKIAYDFYKIYYGTSSPQPRYVCNEESMTKIVAATFYMLTFLWSTIQ